MIRPDITNTLNNYALTCEQNARLQRQRAAEAQAEIDYDSAGVLGYREQHRQEAQRANDQAEAWEARAAEAKRGYFLARQEDLADGGWTRDFGDIFSACQAEGRCVYEATTQDVRIQQDANGPQI